MSYVVSTRITECPSGAPHLCRSDYWTRESIASKGDTVDGIVGLDIVIRPRSQRTHGRANPSGAILSLTILSLEPGPMEAETLPQAAASSKARERSFDIDIS